MEARYLTNEKGELGDYRAIYTIDDEAQEVLVLDVGHRRDIYR